MPETKLITKQHTNDAEKIHLVGQKPPLKPKEVWSIRVRIEISGNKRNLALFNLVIDSKLRSCDLVTLRAGDVSLAGRIRERAIVVQQKTNRPVQFELTEQTRESIADGVSCKQLQEHDYLFPSQVRVRSYLSTRQHARIVNHWVESIGLDPHKYGTHSLRRTKAAQICRKTGNLRAVQLLLGHTKLESTVRYLGVEVDDALRIAEQVEL